MQNDKTTMAKALAALCAVIDAVLETVNAAGPSGAPEGPVYAALMPFGVTIQAFESIVRILVDSKRISKRGNVLYPAR